MRLTPASICVNEVRSIHGPTAETASRPTTPDIVASIWIDGSPLGRAPTGYFNLTCELIRTLAVAPREPRKNLRRLVKAFELLEHEDVAQKHVLALVGPEGWDAGFGEFLASSDASRAYAASASCRSNIFRRSTTSRRQ